MNIKNKIKMSTCVNGLTTNQPYTFPCSHS